MAKLRVNELSTAQSKWPKRNSKRMVGSNLTKLEAKSKKRRAVATGFGFRALLPPKMMRVEKGKAKVGEFVGEEEALKEAKVKVEGILQGDWQELQTLTDDMEKL
ncbi:hypothetical protein RIF29_19849 [Crotalaria pallida]|uniref:Uncharacterized protein n=1 Tax=Crotalaria pallida TaxID=3830 RepID=A0AAN9F1Z2_CROPI